jgi:hypothetical protein
MSRAWKVVAVVAVLLLLPVGAFAVGALTAPDRRPTPRPEIRITERAVPTTSPGASPTSAPQPTERTGKKKERNRGGERTRDDDVRVVKPRPTQVDDDDGDDDDADDDSRDDSDD